MAELLNFEFLGVKKPGRQAPGRLGAYGYDLDLADEVKRRRNGLVAFFPLGRADFTRMRRGVLGGLELAQRFLHIAGNFVVGLGFALEFLVIEKQTDQALGNRGAGTSGRGRRRHSPCRRAPARTP